MKKFLRYALVVIVLFATFAWLNNTSLFSTPSDGRPVLLAHPGGTRVLEYMEQTMPEAWPSGLLEFSRDSYTSGNRGGAAVFDIMRRAYDAGQAAGSRAVLYAAAPGLTATALEGEWL